MLVPITWLNFCRRRGGPGGVRVLPRADAPPQSGAPPGAPAQQPRAGGGGARRAERPADPHGAALGWAVDFLGIYVVYGDCQFPYKPSINPV